MIKKTAIHRTSRCPPPARPDIGTARASWLTCTNSPLTPRVYFITVRPMSSAWKPGYSLLDSGEYRVHHLLKFLESFPRTTPALHSRAALMSVSREKGFLLLLMLLLFHGTRRGEMGAIIDNYSTSKLWNPSITLGIHIWYENTHSNWRQHTSAFLMAAIVSVMYSSSASAVLRWPALQALWRGVHPSRPPSVAWDCASAPASNSFVHTATSPWSAAKWSGVRPIYDKDASNIHSFIQMYFIFLSHKIY